LTFVNLGIVSRNINMRPKPSPAVVDECCTSVTERVLAEDEAEVLAGMLAALADPVRLKMFSMIAANGTVCSCDFEGPVDRSQPTISHHTKVLAEAGLIEGEKQGRWMYWRIVPERLARLRSALG
jgi:ArsR family transcriptional regulator